MGPARFGSCRNWPNDHSVASAQSSVSRSGLGSCDRCHKLPSEYPIIFWTPREADGRLHGQK
jgi:hypothetical protein